MSIFGPSVKKPTNFENSIYYKNFTKAFDKLCRLEIKTKDKAFDLRKLLFKPLADITKRFDSKAEKYYVKMYTKALLQLVETATGYDDYAKKEVLIDRDVMQNVVEPLVWAQLNTDTELAKQIFVVAKNVSGETPFDIKFFQALSDEEMKLNYVLCRGALYNTNIKNDLRKLVFNPKCMDFDAIGELFCNYKFKLSKEEFEILWTKYKPYLVDYIRQYSGKSAETDENGVKHIYFNSRVMGLLFGYIKDFVPGFDGVVCDGKYTVWAPYDSCSSHYISMQFIDRFDNAVYEMKAAQEKDEMKKLQLKKDGLDKQIAAEIQAIKDFVAARKVKIQNIKIEKQEIEGKLKAIEEENKNRETERAQAELQKKQAEFEALAAQLGVDPADLLALQKKKQQAEALQQNQKQYQ